MKKLFFRSCSIFMIIILIISSIAFLSSCTANKTQNEQVDSKVESVFEKKDFDNLSEEEKKEKINQTLEKLESDGYIKEDSVKYDEAYKLFSFEYADGTLGGVSLYEFNEEYNEGSATSNIDNSSKETDEEKNVIILNAFENTPNRRDYYEDLEKEWDAKGLETTVDTDVTLDDLQNLSDYNIIVFAMHGAIYNEQPILAINQEVTSATDRRYESILEQKSVAKIFNNGSYHYWVLPDFFTKNYSEDEIKSDLVFSETCCFFGDDSISTTPDHSFSDALLQVSQGCVIGYHNSVGMYYSRDVMKHTVDTALGGKTFSSALEDAKSTYGENDGVENLALGKYIAYPVFDGVSSQALVEISVSDFTIPNEMIVTLGELSVIEPEIAPVEATGYSIKWSSSDESVATVSPTGEAGIITTLAKGTTTITAELTSGGKTITKTTNLKVASKARDTVLVLDVSGSMYGEPLEEMKKSAIQFCNDLLKDEYNNRVGIVFYDDEITTIDLTNDLDMLISRIENIDDGGLTNMEAGLAAADRMLKNSSATTIKNVVIMADGLPNDGKTSNSGSMPSGAGYDYDQDLYANAVIDTAKQMNSYNIYSLGFFHGLYSEAKDFATLLMKELTNQTDGYYQVDRAEDLQFAFGDISEEISVGSKIVINIACPVDVTVKYGGEMLSSAQGSYCDSTSFGTLHLLGKNKDIKVVSLDSDKQYDVEITGTGEGKMDYSISYFDENEKLTDTRSFESVTITKTTVIKSNTDNKDKEIKLAIDHDGDGTIDENWSALKNEKGKKQGDNNEGNNKKTEPPVEKDYSEIILIVSIIAVVLIGGTVVTIVALVVGDNKTRTRFEVDIKHNTGTNSQISLDGSIWVKCRNCGLVHDVHAYDKDEKIVCPKCNAVIDKTGQDKTDTIKPITQKTDNKLGIVQVVGGSMDGYSISVNDGQTVFLGKDTKFANLVFTAEYKHVSRMHCAITFDADKNMYYVVDNSLNGTFINSKKCRLTKGKRTPVGCNTELLLANEKCKVILR